MKNIALFGKGHAGSARAKAASPEHNGRMRMDIRASL